MITEYNFLQLDYSDTEIFISYLLEDSEESLSFSLFPSQETIQRVLYQNFENIDEEDSEEDDGYYQAPAA